MAVENIKNIVTQGYETGWRADYSAESEGKVRLISEYGVHVILESIEEYFGVFKELTSEEKKYFALEKHELVPNFEEQSSLTFDRLDFVRKLLIGMNIFHSRGWVCPNVADKIRFNIASDGKVDLYFTSFSAFQGLSHVKDDVFRINEIMEKLLDSDTLDKMGSAYERRASCHSAGDLLGRLNRI